MLILKYPALYTAANINPTTLPPTTASTPPTNITVTSQPAPYHQSLPTLTSHHFALPPPFLIVPVPLLTLRAPPTLPSTPASTGVVALCFPLSRNRPAGGEEPVATIPQPQIPTTPKQTTYEMSVQKSVNRQMSVE